jgi:hypothetical protein
MQPPVLSISLIARLVGERAWQLFATSSKITSLIIKGVEPSGNPLKRCADLFLQLNLSQILRYFSDILINLHFCGVKPL